jgi:hypothetical protein
MRPFSKLALLALVAMAALPALAKQPRTTDTLEANADMLSMPAMVSGILVVKTCATCKELTLQASASTQYVIGKQQVTFNEFAAFTRSNGKSFVAVSYEVASARLLRLTAPSSTPAR